MNEEDRISSLLRIIESLKKSRKQWINKCSEVNKENQQLEERINKARIYVEQNIRDIDYDTEEYDYLMELLVRSDVSE